MKANIVKLSFLMIVVTAITSLFVIASISPKNEGGSMLQQNAVLNQTRSLQIVEVLVNEVIQPLKPLNGEKRDALLKDYSFSLKNNSAKALDGIIFAAYDDNTLKSVHTYFLHYSDKVFLPQERLHYVVRRIQATHSLKIAAIIFTDKSYEGDPVLAQELLTRWEGARRKLTDFRVELMAISQMPDDIFTTRLNSFTQRMRIEAASGQSLNKNIEKNSFSESFSLGEREAIDIAIRQLGQEGATTHKKKADVQRFLAWMDKKLGNYSQLDEKLL